MFVKVDREIIWVFHNTFTRTLKINQINAVNFMTSFISLHGTVCLVLDLVILKTAFKVMHLFLPGWSKFPEFT